MIRRRSAFTLLEIMLTLSIAGIIIAAVGAAIQMHFRVVDAGRAEVEQAQLARVLLRRMADDLRAALPVPTEEDDASSTAAAAASTAASAASGTSSSSGLGSSGGSASKSGGGSTSGGASSPSGSSGGASSAAAAATAASSGASDSSDDDAPTQPNFLGSQSEVQVDVSRLPDAHQFAAATSDAAMSGALHAADSLSDVKTVSYYLGSITNGTTTTDPFAPPTASNAPNSGLVRRQLSRAASVFGASQGGVDATSFERLLATEAVGLAFRYYDGTQWLTDWDSSSTAALPHCVEILLTLRSAAPGVASDPLSLFSSTSNVLEKTYRLVVAIPAAGTASTTSTSSSSSSDSESGS